MRPLSDLLGTVSSKHAPKQPAIQVDEKTIFYLFEKVIRAEYGERGRQQIHPQAFSEGELILLVASPLWANELSIQEQVLLERLNTMIGSEEVTTLTIRRGLPRE